MSRHESSETSTEQEIAQAVAKIIEYKDWIAYKDLVGYLTQPSNVLSKASASQKADVVIAKIQIHRYDLHAQTILSLIGQGGLLEGANLDKKILLFSKWLEQRDSFISFQDLASVTKRNPDLKNASTAQKGQIFLTYLSKEKAEIPTVDELLTLIAKGGVLADLSLDVKFSIFCASLQKDKEYISITLRDLNELVDKHFGLQNLSPQQLQQMSSAWYRNRSPHQTVKKIDPVELFKENLRSKDSKISAKVLTTSVNEELGFIETKEREEIFNIWRQKNKITFDELIGFLKIDGFLNKLKTARKLELIEGWIDDDQNNSEIDEEGFSDKLYDLAVLDGVFTKLEPTTRIKTILKLLQRAQKNITSSQLITMLDNEDKITYDNRARLVILWLEEPQNSFTAEEFINLFANERSILLNADLKYRPRILMTLLQKQHNIFSENDFVNLFQAEDILEEISADDKYFLIIAWQQRPQNNFTKDGLGKVFVGNGQPADDQTQLTPDHRGWIILYSYKKENDLAKKQKLLSLFIEDGLLQLCDIVDLVNVWLEEETNNLSYEELVELFNNDLWHEKEQREEVILKWLEKPENKKLELTLEKINEHLNQNDESRGIPSPQASTTGTQKVKESSNQELDYSSS